MGRHFKRQTYRAGTLVALVVVAPLTAGCGSISVFMADAWPHWAGGLPAEAPPRPSDPRYEEFARALAARAEGAAAPAPAEAKK